MNNAMINLPNLSGFTLPFDMIPVDGDYTELNAALAAWAKGGCVNDFGIYFDRWVKGDLSSQSTDELSAMIANWTGCLEDLILMVMIAVSKDMDKHIKAKAEEVLQLRQKAEKQKGADKSTEALDQATQELQQMQKQRDQFWGIFQKILDGLTASTDKLLQSWRTG